MTKTKLVNSLFTFILIFTSTMVGAQEMSEEKTLEKRCIQYTEGITKLQQGQLDLVSIDCQEQQPYPNGVVKKSSSICSLGYLQKKYNALQANAAILFGLKKLNADVVAEYNRMGKIDEFNLGEAKKEAEDLSTAVKKVNVFHSLLKNQAFVKHLENNKIDDTFDINAVCKKAELHCPEMDKETKEMVTGFLTHYNKKKANSPDKITTIAEDFAVFDKLLIEVPSDSTMNKLKENIALLSKDNLTDLEKQNNIAEIQSHLNKLKESNLFFSKMGPEKPDDLIGDIISLSLISDHNRKLTTSAIELLAQDLDPVTGSSETLDENIGHIMTENKSEVTAQYQKFKEQSLVDQNEQYSTNLSNSIQKEIDSMVGVSETGKQQFTNSACPGDINQYQNLIDNKVLCNALYNKYKDLVKAHDFAKKDKTQMYSAKVNEAYRSKLVEIGCLNEELSTDQQYLDDNRKTILSCLDDKAKKGDLDKALAKNRSEMDAVNNQLEQIYNLPAYKKSDRLKNAGIKVYFNKGCDQNKVKDQQNSQYYSCTDQPQETNFQVFMSSTNQVITQMDQDANFNKIKMNQKEKKADQVNLVDACADKELAERSGIVCATINFNDGELKDSEKVALKKDGYSYKFEDGKIVPHQKKSASNYYGAGLINSMGTAVSTFRNYQNTMAVTNMWKQTATYSAYADYNNKNQLYWKPSVPQSYSNPYLYTGSPLGSVNPYSTNFNYNNNSFYYNTSYDPLASTAGGTGGNNNSGTFSGFN